jgi:hypothetical protein
MSARAAVPPQRELCAVGDTQMSQVGRKDHAKHQLKPRRIECAGARPRAESKMIRLDVRNGHEQEHDDRRDIQTTDQKHKANGGGERASH